MWAQGASHEVSRRSIQRQPPHRRSQPSKAAVSEASCASRRAAQAAAPAGRLALAVGFPLCARTRPPGLAPRSVARKPPRAGREAATGAARGAGRASRTGRAAATTGARSIAVAGTLPHCTGTGRQTPQHCRSAKRTSGTIRALTVCNGLTSRHEARRTAVVGQGMWLTLPKVPGSRAAQSTSRLSTCGSTGVRKPQEGRRRVSHLYSVRLPPRPTISPTQKSAKSSAPKAAYRPTSDSGSSERRAHTRFAPCASACTAA